MGVGGHEGEADERLVARHGGRDDGGHEDAVDQQVVGDGEGLHVVADEERDDGRLGVAYLEAQVLEGLEGVALIVPQGGVALGFAAHDVQGLEHRGGAGGSDAGGEDVGTHAVFHPIDSVLVGSDEAAHRGEALAEGAHDELHIVELAEVVAGAATFTAEDAEAVGLVDHQRGAVFVADVHHLVHVGHVALHRENAVGDHQLGGLDGHLGEHALKVGHVVVAVFLRAGKGDELALHDAGVHALVIEEVIATADHVGNDAAVGQETSREEHHAVLAEELGQLVLQLYVDVEGAVEERRAGATGAVLVNGALGGLFQTRVVGQAQVAVRAEHKDGMVVSGDIHFGVLLAADGGEVRINTQGSHLLGVGVLC